MNNDIKEILDFKEDADYKRLSYGEIKILSDTITNLQEEVEDLRESDWAWHQTLKAQNKREYRSKFLKEFQEEFGTNTFPDYDEIYKRYDRLKKENKRLKEVLKNNGVVKTCENCEWFGVCPHSYREYDYKSRNEKAIDNIDLVIELIKQQPTEDDTWILNRLNGFKYILQGSDKE